MEDLNAHFLIKAYIAHNRFGELLGMDFEILSEGEVNYHMEITRDHLATPAASHGGAIAALMDAALGVASLSVVCLSNRVVSTVEMNIRFLRPALLGDELTARASVISRGNRIIVTESKIYNQHNQLVAIGSGTFNAYPMEKAGFLIQS